MVQGIRQAITHTDSERVTVIFVVVMHQITHFLTTRYNPSIGWVCKQVVAEYLQHWEVHGSTLSREYLAQDSAKGDIHCDHVWEIVWFDYAV